MDMQVFTPLIDVDNQDYYYYYYYTIILIIIVITSYHRLTRKFSSVEIWLLTHNRKNRIERNRIEFMSFVSFWSLEIMAELTDRSTLNNEWHGQNIGFKK